MERKNPKLADCITYLHCATFYLFTQVTFADSSISLAPIHLHLTSVVVDVDIAFFDFLALKWGSKASAISRISYSRYVALVVAYAIRFRILHSLHLKEPPEQCIDGIFCFSALFPHQIPQFNWLVLSNQYSIDKAKSALKIDFSNQIRKNCKTPPNNGNSPRALIIICYQSHYTHFGLIAPVSSFIDVQTYGWLEDVHTNSESDVAAALVQPRWQASKLVCVYDILICIRSQIAQSLHILELQTNSFTADWVLIAWSHFTHRWKDATSWLWTDCSRVETTYVEPLPRE